MKIDSAIVTALLLIFSSAVLADGPPRLAVDTNLYPYLDRIKSDTDLTVIINARFPAKFSYFGYMNYRGAVSDGQFDFVRSEQNLRWTISEELPLDLSIQGILIAGGSNDITQLGVSWRVHHTPGLDGFFDRINLVYRVTFQLKRFSSEEDDAWQMEHFFKMRFPTISDRLYLSGFVDQTFDQQRPDVFPKSPIVAEVQVGARLWNRFYAVAEYRHNEFRLGNESNLAVGIEYKFLRN